MTEKKRRWNLLKWGAWAWWRSHSFGEIRCSCGQNIRVFAVGDTAYSHDLTTGRFEGRLCANRDVATEVIWAVARVFVAPHAPQERPKEGTGTPPEQFPTSATCT